MKKIFLLILCLSFFRVASAQNKYIDSIRVWLVAHPQADSLRVLNLHKLSYRLSEINPTEAWQVAFQTYQTAQKLGNQSSIGLSYINYALLEWQDGDFAKSQEHYLMAVNIFQKSGWRRGISISYNNMGENYIFMGQYDKCVEYTLKALEINQKIDEKRGQAINYEQLAKAYYFQQNYPESLLNCKKGLEICSKTPESALAQVQAQLLTGVGKNLAAMGQYDEAFKNFEQAIVLCQSHQERMAELDALREMAVAFSLKKEYKKAIEYLQKAQKIATALDVKVKQVEIFKVFAEVYQQAGMYNEALASHKSFKELNDQIEAKKNLVRLELIDIKRQYSEKKQENSLLTQITENQEAELKRKSLWILGLVALVLGVIGTAVYVLYRNKIAEIKRVSEARAETIRQMQLSEKIRTQIARDLHDDLGATLSSISMLSQVAKRQIPDHETDIKELLTAISDNSQHTVSTIRDIIWTTKPINDTIEVIADKMNVFAHEILETNGIRYKISIDKVLLSYHLPATQQYHFYLIFKEAVNNIAKYAQAHQVWVEIFQRNKQVVMEIRDDGAGFDFNQQRGRGNGLLNMEKQAEAMEGTLVINTSEGQGTLITLEMPMMSTFVFS